VRPFSHKLNAASRSLVGIGEERRSAEDGSFSTTSDERSAPDFDGSADFTDIS